jgi:hypothetical protein
VIVLGIVFVVAALGAGCSPLSVTENGSPAQCGNAWDGLNQGDAMQQDQHNESMHDLGGYGPVTNFADKCQSKKDTHSVLSGVAGVIGLGLLLGGCFLPTRKPEPGATPTLPV